MILDKKIENTGKCKHELFLKKIINIRSLAKIQGFGAGFFQLG